MSDIKEVTNGMTTNNEKLSRELFKDLIEVTKSFINLNKFCLEDLDLFTILQNSSVCYLANIMELLVKQLSSKNDILRFIDENKEHLDSYINKIRKENNI